MGVFNMENILSGAEVTANDLFGDEPDNNSKETQEIIDNNTPDNKENDQTTEIHDASAEDVFGDDSEEVSSQQNNEGTEDAVNDTNSKNSPNDSDNFYSSITDALVDEQVFQTLSPEDIKGINSAEDFRDAFEKEINSRLDERNRRINQALSVGVEPSAIKEYEGTLGFLDQITPEILSEESQRGEDIRKKLIQQSFMNRGYSPEKAQKMTSKLFESGDDIEEAKEALEENKKYFNTKYTEVINSAKAEEEKYKKKKQKQAETLKNEILNNAKFFEDIELDKNTRQKVVDNIMKPIHKDPDTGDYYTELQKYEKENPNEFIKNVGYLFTLTDGFKDLSRLVKPSARKEVKSKLKELETTLSNTGRKGTSMNFVSTASNNNNEKSFWEKGFVLDLK